MFLFTNINDKSGLKAHCQWTVTDCSDALTFSLNDFSASNLDFAELYQ